MLNVVFLFTTLCAEVPMNNNNKPEPLFQVTLADKSELRNCTIKTEFVVVKTKYGELKVPVHDINTIVFAHRDHPQMCDECVETIKQLNHPSFTVREQAQKRLLQLAPYTYRTIVRYKEKCSDLETVQRVNQVLKNTHLPNLEEQDTVTTNNDKFKGSVVTEYITVHTQTLGQIELHISLIKCIAKSKSESEGVVLAPHNLTQYHGQLGRRLTFNVVGPDEVPPLSEHGHHGVWGTGTYTLDSNFALAAIHAGVVKPREVKTVTVEIVKHEHPFTSTVRNGVCSGAYTPPPQQPYYGFVFVNNE